MKKIAVILLLSLLLPATRVASQNIVLGQRIPELKFEKWLQGQTPPQTQLTYVEFFYSSNPACKSSLERLKGITNKLGTKLRVIVVAQEKEELVAPLLAPYLSPRISVGLDPGGRIAEAFGVNYVPFGILLDAKNRALWLGNSLQLTPELIEQTSK